MDLNDLFLLLKDTFYLTQAFARNCERTRTRDLMVSYTIPFESSRSMIISGTESNSYCMRSSQATVSSTSNKPYRPRIHCL